MPPFSKTILILTVLITVHIGLISGKCRFPEFLQREHPWVGDYKDGPLLAYVNPTFITISETFEGGSTHAFTKDCVKRGPDNKFLVRLKEKKHPTKYQCMQFLKRSDNIVQIKTSDRFDRQTMEICNEDQMRIDPFPLVQLIKGRNASLDCPFVGGYNFYAYYPHPNNSLVCRNNRLLMRMESECERGGGIVLDFRKENCVPKGLPRNPIQRAHCVAHWTQESYTFIVLRHAEENDKWWCMRTSDPLTDISKAYLWMQVVCDLSTHPDPEISQNYLKLEFNRRVFSSTCVDEIEVCQGAQHYCNASYKQHCALTCGECLSEDQIGLCTFDEQYRGQWMDSGQNGNFLIDVETYTFDGRRLGNYNCLNLETDVYPEKRVLLETYENGCLPRYACAEMSKVNSSVMKFRLGDRHTWPLPNIKSKKEYICKPENFQIHHRAESRFTRERPPRLIVNTRDIKEVPCGIPAHLQNGIAFLEDGRRCGGCLYYDPSTNPNHFVVRPVNCSFDSNPLESEETSRRGIQPISYSCMASMQIHNGSYSVITKTTSLNRGMGQYLVWIFTRRNNIKVMKASEMYVYQHNRHVRSEYVLAQFSILRQDKFKCRMNTYHGHRNTTTTTTTSSNVHWIVDHRTRTTPQQDRNNNKGKYTYDPDNEPYDPEVVNPAEPRVTPHPGKSGNLKGDAGKSSLSVYRCNISFYAVLLLSLTATWKLTLAPHASLVT